jgi:hypothetical protein
MWAVCWFIKAAALQSNWLHMHAWHGHCALVASSTTRTTTSDSARTTRARSTREMQHTMPDSSVIPLASHTSVVHCGTCVRN